MFDKYLYRFEDLKSKKSDNPPSLNKLTLAVAELKQAKQAIKEAQAIANGVKLTKEPKDK